MQHRNTDALHPLMPAISTTTHTCICLYLCMAVYVDADPVLARQLLPATPERGTTYQMVPVSRTPSSFSSRDPRYARFRSGLTGNGPRGSLHNQPTEVTVAQVGVDEVWGVWGVGWETDGWRGDHCTIICVYGSCWCHKMA